MADKFQNAFVLKYSLPPYSFEYKEPLAPIIVHKYQKQQRYIYYPLCVKEFLTNAFLTKKKAIEQSYFISVQIRYLRYGKEYYGMCMLKMFVMVFKFHLGK